MKKSTLCRKIAEIPAIGPITATAVVAAVGDARQFRNGQHLSAWLGLAPRQYSSGGKPLLHYISRRGDTYLRTLLIHGARAVLRYAAAKTDPQSLWLQRLMARAAITARRSHWPTGTRGSSRRCPAAMPPT